MPGDIIWISNNPLSSGKGSGKTDRFDCIETARICWQTASQVKKRKLSDRSAVKRGME